MVENPHNHRTWRIFMIKVSIWEPMHKWYETRFQILSSTGSGFVSNARNTKYDFWFTFRHSDFLLGERIIVFLVQHKNSGMPVSADTSYITSYHVFLM